MTEEQLDRANKVSTKIINVKEKLISLKTAQSWGDDDLIGTLELRRYCVDGSIKYDICLEEVNTVRTLIDILYCKYNAKLKELEKEFEEL